MTSKEEDKSNLKSIIFSALFPLVFVITMWLVKMGETILHQEFTEWGIFPQTALGLRGILFSPFLHGSWAHLVSNTLPFLLLGFGLFNFYKSKAWIVLGFIYIFSGFLTWIMGRESYHIGASSIIYGLEFFILISAIIRREQRLMAFSMLIIFLYGSIVWGFFPQFFPNENISWEGHLSGAISGAIMAYYYRKDGPHKKEFFNDEDSYEPTEDEYWMTEQTEEKES